MKTIKTFPEKADPVITEARAIKQAIVAEHGGDLESFFSGIRLRQSRNPLLVSTTGQFQEEDNPAPSTPRPEAKP
jgi:hypothetical protein